MKRRPLSTVLFVLLVVALGALVFRRANGPSVPEGLVQLGDIDRLEWEAFALPQDGSVVVKASGSVGADGQLEAFGWILDRATRRVVWRMTSAKSRAAEGTRREQTDTLRLPAGTYEAYFSGDGRAGRQGGALARIANRKETWRNDRALWYLSVRPLDGVAASRVPGDPSPARGTVWTSAPQSGGAVRQTLDVQRPASVRLRFVASEIGSSSRAVLVRLPERTVVWEAGAAGSRAAGGAARNRVVEATVALAPGLYEAESSILDDHAFGRWAQTPPDDPFAWGLTVTAADTGAVAAFDVWRRTPAIRYEARTGGNEHTVAFTVSDTLAAYVVAMGEITGSDDSDRYDYGWITNEATGARVWEMRRDETEPAGGDSKNRRAERLFSLDPGRYTLHFVTDDSHHGGAFNGDAPDSPERYGIALFNLGAAGALAVTGQTDTNRSGDASSGSSTSGSSSTGSSSSGSSSPASDAPPAVVAFGPVPAPPSSAGSLAAITRAGSNSRDRERFRLEGDARLRVYATGERAGDSWYDWAQIEDENGDVVWSMKDAALQSAGGADKNVLFDGLVSLTAGTYRLVFESDGSHNHGNYDADAAPTHNFWGAIVRRAPSAGQ